MKLDIACGQNKTKGFKGIDIAPIPGVDIVHDLTVYPWPIKANTVTEITSNHYVEHIPHYRPDYKGVDGWWMFFNELHRICKKGAKLTFTHPYSRSDRAFWDPTHTRYIHEMAWSYLSKDWRTSQGLDHYDATCDFGVVAIAGSGMEQQIALRHHEAQTFARTFYFNVIPDLIVELVKQ